MNKDNKDIDLWEKARTGDKEAFENIFKAYHRYLHNYGLKHTSNMTLLEDCIQDLFIELWEKAANIEVRNFKAYLFQSFRFKIYRQIEKNERIRIVNDNTDDHSCFTLSHEDFIINKESDEALSCTIKQAISKLTKKQQEIIYLRFYQDMDYDEICEVMQINYQVSRNLMYQAIKELKKDLSIVALSTFLTQFLSVHNFSLL